MCRGDGRLAEGVFNTVRRLAADAGKTSSASRVRSTAAVLFDQLPAGGDEAFLAGAEGRCG